MKSSIYFISATFVISFFKVLVSLKIKLSQLYLPLSIFNYDILDIYFTLLNILHHFSNQFLKHLSYWFRRLDWYLVVITLFRVLKCFNIMCKVLIVFRRVKHCSPKRVFPIFGALIDIILDNDIIPFGADIILLQKRIHFLSIGPKYSLPYTWSEKLFV